ncbi:MAG: hypothetical protein ACKOE5_06930 [Cytophagales bacterium]
MLTLVRLVVELKKLTTLLLVVLALSGSAQTSEEQALLASLTISNTIPNDLLSARTVVLFQNTVGKPELQETQKYFQQTGIDAVCYFDIAYVLAGTDTRRAFATYFSFRNIKYIVLLQKADNQYHYVFGTFCGNKDIFDRRSTGWRQSNPSQQEVLRTIYRLATSNLKKQNFLINDLPEMDIPMTYFTGRINHNFSVEAKSFKTAVPKMDNEKDNAELEALLKQYYPFKFEMVDAKSEEADLGVRGFRSVLRVLHGRGSLLRQVLGYDYTQTGRSIATTFFADGVPQIKTILASEDVYKFYIKNIEYGNIFLGNKWDADITWQDALRNYVMAYRADAKIN